MLFIYQSKWKGNLYRDEFCYFAIMPSLEWWVDWSIYSSPFALLKWMLRQFRLPRMMFIRVRRNCIAQWTQTDPNLMTIISFRSGSLYCQRNHVPVPSHCLRHTVENFHCFPLFALTLFIVSQQQLYILPSRKNKIIHH